MIGTSLARTHAHAGRLAPVTGVMLLLVLLAILAIKLLNIISDTCLNAWLTAIPTLHLTFCNTKVRNTSLFGLQGYKMKKTDTTTCLLLYYIESTKSEYQLLSLSTSLHLTFWYITLWYITYIT